MTIRQIMDRIAGEDHQWQNVDPHLMGMGGADVIMAVLTGEDETGRPYLFRLPIETLKRK